MPALIARAAGRALVATVALASLVGGAACRREAPRPAGATNVLLISLDTVRQDVLGTYGHEPRHAAGVSTSPALTALAHEGVRMTEAYSSSSWTLPSHISLMTGRPALAHGVESEGAVLDPTIPTLAEILSNHGYRTAGIYSAPYLDPYWGFARGFDSYTAVYGEQATDVSQRVAALRRESEDAAAAADWTRYDATKRRLADVETELNDQSQTVITSEQVAAATVAQLDELAHDGRPWFVFAHFFDAHCDYVPPPPYDTRFDPDYDGTFTGKGCMGGPAVGTPDPEHPGALIRTIGARDLEHAYALYEGEVAWVDDHLGTILRALDRSGMAKNTLVIVVADHGEEFFEHAGLGHRRTLYEEVVRIPMVLRLPGVLPADRAIAGPVSLPDVLPTVLDVLGLAPVATPGGASFFPALRTATPVEHTPILRTIMMFSGEVSVDAGAPVTLRQVVVHDGFRHGTVKITRRRSWPQFQAGLAPTTQAILQTEAGKQYAHEDLRWIDLARSPEEAEARQSTDFTDPAARAALDEFRRAYGAMLESRPPRNQSTALPHNIRSRLESLGYIERTTGPSFPEPDLVLPPPGDH